jgi:hypothetical protein
MKFLIVVLLLSACGDGDGSKSFSFVGILSAFHPKNIVDGFNLTVNKSLGDDHHIENIQKIYADPKDIMNDLRKKALDKKEELWHPVIKKEYLDFLDDAKKHGIEIKDYSTSRLLGGKLVEDLSGKERKKAVALCVRTNFRTSPIEKDTVYRIEVLKNKYEEIQKKIEKEKKIKSLQHLELLPSQILLKRVLYHEFMHCVFHVSHLPDKLEYRDHIMYSKYNKEKAVSLEEWYDMLRDNFNSKYIGLMPYVE